MFDTGLRLHDRKVFAPNSSKGEPLFAEVPQWFATSGSVPLANYVVCDVSRLDEDTLAVVLRRDYLHQSGFNLDKLWDAQQDQIKWLAKQGYDCDKAKPFWETVYAATPNHSETGCYLDLTTRERAEFNLYWTDRNGPEVLRSFAPYQ